MHKRISKKSISLPPYLSTSWENVSSIHVQGGDQLVFVLLDGSEVAVPGLDDMMIESIFEHHAAFIEAYGEPMLSQEEVSEEANAAASIKELLSQGGGGSALLGPDILLSGMGGMQHMMEHNMQYKDMDDLPAEVLDKITKLSSLLGANDNLSLPEAEPHCNCFHCQVARAMHSGAEGESVEEEEIVTDEDLRFRTWDIEQEGENLYTVTDPFDSAQMFRVYLGDTLGCTCGVKNCEHIKAVLEN